MYTAASPYGQVSSLPNVQVQEVGSYYTSPSVQTYASPQGLYAPSTLAAGTTYTGGTIAGAPYSGGTIAGGAYTGGTLASAYGGTTAIAGGAYTPGTISGGSYSPSNAAYTGGTVAGTTYTPGTITTGAAYTPGSIAGGVTTVSAGNYSSAPAYGTGTGSFSIAPANTYGGYYGAGSYSVPVADGGLGVRSASFTVPPMGQDLYGGTSGLPAAPSMLLNPMNPLQSAPSMIAYSGLPGLGQPGYSSAMDGPFKFYATPPGKLPEAQGPGKMDDGAQTGGSLRAGVASEPREDKDDGKKVKKYGSKKKKSSGCC